MNKAIFQLPLLAIALVLAAAQSARAQFGGGQMGMGGMSGGSMGMGASSRGLGQSSSYGAFGSRTLGGGFNPSQRTFSGGAGGAGGGMPGGLGLQNQGAAGTMTGNERFLRQNQRPGQFVGSDSGDAANFIGALSQAVGSRAGGMGFGGQSNSGRQSNRQANRQNQNQNQNRGANRRNQSSPLRTTYVAAFNFPSAAPATLAGRLTTQFAASKKLSAIQPIQVEMQGQTAVLRGVVANSHERDLAAQLALLEPGVSQIQNDLQVAPANSLPEPELPAPANSAASR